MSAPRPGPPARPAANIGAARGDLARRPALACAWALAAASLTACPPPAPPPSPPDTAPARPAEASSAAPSAADTGATPTLAISAATPSPAPDVDGDGVPTGEDACPYEHHGPHPSPTEHGCPTYVRLAPDRIGLLAPVEFDIDKARLRPASLPILDEIAHVLSTHPEIALLEIQVHGRSDPYAAVHLTQKRAQAVRKALVERGIEPSRLIAKGYGEDRPIARPDTEEGRRLNRRVELWILPAPGATR